MMPSFPTPLTPAQVAILRLFQHDLPEEDWEALRRLIARFFADRLTAEANKAWDEKGWTDQDMERLLNTRERYSG